MVAAVAYLHGRKPDRVIHRDIKPSNFMLTSSLRVKLGDFGVSKLTHKKSTYTGSGNLLKLNRPRSSEMMSPETWPEMSGTKPIKTSTSKNKLSQ